MKEKLSNAVYMAIIVAFFGGMIIAYFIIPLGRFAKGWADKQQIPANTEEVGGLAFQDISDIFELEDYDEETREIVWEAYKLGYESAIEDMNE